MNYEKKIQELYIELPELALSKGGGVRAVRSGKLLFVEGCLPYSDGKLMHRGRVGMELSVDQGVQAARYAVIQALSAIHATAGSVNQVKQIVKLSGSISSGPDFKEHERILDGAGQLLVQVFGSAGRAAQSAVGVLSLPQGASVSLSLIIELK